MGKRRTCCNQLLLIIQLKFIYCIFKLLLGWTMKSMLQNFRPSYLPLESKTMVSKTLLLEL